MPRHRRALTLRWDADQFLAKAILLAALGGAVGAAATVTYANARGWAVVIPPAA